jgi:uncharacterized membrane protein YedE/YeeE
MVDPAKVLAFLDFAGRWDPSLLLVMLGALTAALPGFRVALRRPSPLLGGRFVLPTSTAIDRRLIGGAVLFGVGWGLVGFCPGPAIASLVLGLRESLAFVAAMFAGAWLSRLASRPKAVPDTQAERP